MNETKVFIEAFQKEELNIIDAMTLIDSTVSNINREAMCNSINESLN